MENMTPPTPEQQPSTPPVPVQASIPYQSFLQPPSHPRISPHMGVMISFLGILLLGFSLALPWITNVNCAPGACDVLGWDILTAPFLIIWDGLFSFGTIIPAFVVTELILLPFTAAMIFVILIIVLALGRAQKPLNDQWDWIAWYWRALLASGFCLIGVFLLNVVQPSYYSSSIGSWVAVGGFLVVSIGCIWQIRLAKET